MAEIDSSVWCFSSSTDERVKVKVLGEDSAYFFLALLGDDQRASWFIQKDENPPEFIAHSTLFRSTPREQASIQESIKVVREEKRAAERRLHYRLDCNVEIVISKKDKEFKSHTVNLSAGGVLLQEALPEDYIFSSCNIRLLSGDKSLDLSFEARILNANNDLKRVVFHGVSHLATQSIIRWIEEEKRKIPTGF
ncbi:MAG: PilZ domain-containing protein [Bdellovibrionota bacterium]